MEILNGFPLPERLIEIFVRGSDPATARFPQTEIFNEGWMLRLVLDAFKQLEISEGPFGFLPKADWHSEARLASPFRPRQKRDPLGEGFTHADGVVGHFVVREETRAGLQLATSTQQFVVVEAKMLSNLSSGVSNARGYDQAARNVACISQAISLVFSDANAIQDIGFYVLAPTREFRPTRTNLESCMRADSIRTKVRERVQAYADDGRKEAAQLSAWFNAHFEPLLSRLDAEGNLRVVTWNECIDAIGGVDARCADELRAFYDRCLELASVNSKQ